MLKTKNSMPETSVILPAIIPQSPLHLEEILARLSFAPAFQIDIVDGIFATPASWPYEPKGTITDIAAHLSPYRIELDLMVEGPLAAAKEWYAIGVRSFIFHLESDGDIEALRTWKEEMQVTLGGCIGNNTDSSLLTNNIDLFDYVQVMGIDEVGAQGRPFDERALARITELRTQFPHLTISVDGSVNETTLPLLKEAGANRFVVGSAIVGASDPRKAYDNLTSLAQQ